MFAWNEREQVFKLEKTDYWLIPTAEVPVTNIYRDETLDPEKLPISFCAFSMGSDESH